MRMHTLRESCPTGRLLFQRKARLDRHLPVSHFAVRHNSARLDDLEPVDIAQAHRCLGNGLADGIVAADGRCARELDFLVHMIAHIDSLLAARRPDFAIPHRTGGHPAGPDMVNISL
jgi:hypothetical protein